MNIPVASADNTVIYCVREYQVCFAYPDDSHIRTNRLTTSMSGWAKFDISSYFLLAKEASFLCRLHSLTQFTTSPQHLEVRLQTSNDSYDAVAVKTFQAIHNSAIIHIKIDGVAVFQLSYGRRQVYQKQYENYDDIFVSLIAYLSLGGMLRWFSRNRCPRRQHDDDTLKPLANTVCCRTCFYWKPNLSWLNLLGQLDI